MKKISKRTCSLLLTVLVGIGSLLSGCAQTADYTEEIKAYQEKLEILMAENEELKAQLGVLENPTETASDETQTAPTETRTSETESQTESQTETEALPTQTASETAEETGAEQPAETDAETEDPEERISRILVLGDSIWGNYRDETGVAAKVTAYMAREGYQAEVYNAAIGGTRATIDAEDNEWEFGPASENSLVKMLSILDEKTDVELLQGKPAYEDMKAALAVKDKLDVIILAYGMNDFLSQAPINNSDRPWTGFGTALVSGVKAARRICPGAEVMVVAPTYASYFSIPVQNMGEKALYNYASVACDVGRGQETYCVDAYNKLGIDTYNADEYLEDGVHLNEKGRDLYARGIVANLFYGKPGQISGNAIEFD